MRKSFLMLTSALAVSMAAGSAQASTGWYVGLSGGANWLEDSTASQVTPAGVEIPALLTDVDTGWIATGQIGYKWASNWRVEFELGYRENDGSFDTLAGPALIPSSLEVSQFTQMVNVLYDFPITDKWSISVGGGLGGNLIDVNAVGLGGALNDDDYVLAGQLIAQVGYAVTNRLDLYLDYHYTVTDDPEFTNVALAPNNATFEVDNHAVMVGLRYDLSPDAAPAVYVPPPAPPTPTAAPKQFIVFFGFNKSNLTSDAQRVVAEAAAAAKASGSASILVTGHTDTVGSNRYNDRLSMRRANAVKDELVRQGIGAGQITAMGKGETELLVQTGDNVKEPQNRRATIDLN
jgi:OmpA-OmpF porin, OOP family